jgi:long-subunit fatty acid transport protein
MFKKILLSIFILLSLPSFAQESSSSPYSFYGVGDPKFRGTVENRSMGGIGILPDSIHINLQNPASLSSLKLTSFALGGNYNYDKLKTTNNAENSKRFSIDYLAMSFPYGKFGLSLGIMPYSSVGYKVQNSRDNVTTRYFGTGGLNKVFLGGAYQITPKLSAGIEFGFNFGKIENNASLFLLGNEFGTKETNNTTLRGVAFNTGLMYQTKFKKLDVYSSLTFSPSTKLNTVIRRLIGTVTLDASGAEQFNVAPKEIGVPNSSLKLPSRVAFGAGLGQAKKWFVGFESTFQQSSGFANLYQIPDNASYENASKFSLGGYYIPKYNSFSNYFSKITYRAGLRYENTGLKLNSQSINDGALTLGLGLPLSGSFSSINLGFEFGQRGTTKSNLVQENYVNISLGLSFNDRWFIKRRYR